MNKINYPQIIFILLLFCVLSTSASFAQVAIGNINPGASSILDIHNGSNNKGILIPKVSISNLNNYAPIAVMPENGLIVYNTNNTTGVGFYFWEETSWSKLLTESENNNLYSANDKLSSPRTVDQFNYDLYFEGTADKNSLTLQRTTNNEEIGISFQNSDDIFDASISLSPNLNSGIVFSTGGAQAAPANLTPTLTLNNDNSIKFNAYIGGNFSTGYPSGFVTLNSAGDLIKITTGDIITNLNSDWFKAGSSPAAPPGAITDSIYTMGNVGIDTSTPKATLHIYEDNGTPANPREGTVIIEHNNGGGQSSLVFKNKADNTDFGYILYEDDGSGNGSTNENSLFTFGVKGEGANTNQDDINFSTRGSVGISNNAPHETTSLHLGRSDRGLLINRVQLSSKIDSSLIPGNEPNGLLVYNTTAAGAYPNDVIPGFYFWQIDHWQLIDYNRNGVQYYSYYSASGASPDIKHIERDSLSIQKGKYVGLLNPTALNYMKPRNDNFVIKIIGNYFVKNTGEFNFASNSDDGARIYIDGSLILDLWTDSGNNDGEAAVNLVKGKHEIEFWFYENGGGEKFTFSWGANPDNNTGTINTNQFILN